MNSQLSVPENALAPSYLFPRLRGKIETGVFPRATPPPRTPPRTRASPSPLKTNN